MDCHSLIFKMISVSCSTVRNKNFPNILLMSICIILPGFFVLPYGSHIYKICKHKVTFHISITVQMFAYYYIVIFRKTGMVVWKAKTRLPTGLKECKR